MKLKLKNKIKFFISVVIIIAALAFVEKKQNKKKIHNIHVFIYNQQNSYFIDQNNILSLLNDSQNIRGKSYKEIVLKNLENRIKSHKFVKETEIYKDLKGNLLINVEQRRPIARIVRAGMPDAYISETGFILPMSDKYTARVPIIQGSIANQLIEEGYLTTKGDDILKLLQYIDQKKFWKAQIAELNINKKKQVTFYTQVSKQYIEFGKPEDIEQKFNKLSIFYKEILPTKGWNYYQRVNVTYHNQIVCE